MLYFGIINRQYSKTFNYERKTIQLNHHLQRVESNQPDLMRKLTLFPTSRLPCSRRTSILEKSWSAAGHRKWKTRTTGRHHCGKKVKNKNPRTSLFFFYIFILSVILQVCTVQEPEIHLHCSRSKIRTLT